MTSPAGISLPERIDGYSQLQPHLVLEALDSVGLKGDGRLLQLNSYENRVFQVFLENGDVVVAKFYRPGRWGDAQILEEHAFAVELAAAEIPIVAPRVLQAIDSSAPNALIGDPPTLCNFRQDGNLFRFSVSDRRAGRGPELDDPTTWQWLGRFLGRLHAMGQARPFVHRRNLDPQTFGHAAKDLLLRAAFIPPDQIATWSLACDVALRLVDQAFKSAAPLRILRLHGDFHPGNILWRDEGPHVVDLDDACNGPAVQDMWMLLDGDRTTRLTQLANLLEGYRSFVPFDDRELRLIEALRTLRMIHHSAWLAERWTDPAFPVAFPWFGTAAYWSEQARQLDEQVQAMQDPEPGPDGHF